MARRVLLDARMKKNPKPVALHLQRETMRALASTTLTQVAAGIVASLYRAGDTWNCGGSSCR